MIRTAILLGLTLIGAVAWSWLYGPSLESQQSELLSHLVTIWAGFTAYTYLAGVLTGNHSQVDRLWSTVPIVYAVYAAWFTDWDPRAILMAGLGASGAHASPSTSRAAGATAGSPGRAKRTTAGRFCAKWLRSTAPWSGKSFTCSSSASTKWA